MYVALLMWPAALLCMASGTLSSCVPGHEDFQWQNIYSARTIKREGSLWRTCLLTVWTAVFISFISSSWNTRWRPEQSHIKVSSVVTRHTQFSFGLLSPLWHPKLLVKKKVWRARAGLAQRTVSRVGVGGLRALFPCLRVKMQLRAVCPRYFLNIWGWNWLYLSTTSPWTGL